MKLIASLLNPRLKRSVLVSSTSPAIMGRPKCRKNVIIDILTTAVTLKTIITVNYDLRIKMKHLRSPPSSLDKQSK